MSASPAPLIVPKLVERIRQCNAESIRRTGSIDPAAVKALLEALLSDLRAREAVLLEIAIFMASHLDDGQLPPL